MRIRSAIVLGFALLSISPARSDAQSSLQMPSEESQKQAIVTRLFAVIGLERQIVELLDLTLDVAVREGAIQAAVLPEAKRYLSAQVPALMQKLRPVYTDAFSAADLAQLVNFYQLPLGQRMAKANLQLVLRSAEVTEEWADDIARRFRRTERDAPTSPGTRRGTAHPDA